MSNVQATERPARMRLDESAIGRMMDRLCAEFGNDVMREAVTDTIEGCLRDLAGTPLPPLPELCERLARQRLLDALDPERSPFDPVGSAPRLSVC